MRLILPMDRLNFAARLAAAPYGFHIRTHPDLLEESPLVAEMFAEDQVGVGQEEVEGGHSLGAYTAAELVAAGLVASTYVGSMKIVSG